jgi:hypothetical protein
LPWKIRHALDSPDHNPQAQGPRHHGKSPHSHSDKLLQQINPCPRNLASTAGNETQQGEGRQHEEGNTGDLWSNQHGGELLKRVLVAL